MLHRLKYGLKLGLMGGLVYAWADSLSLFMTSKKMMNIVWDPFTPTTARIMVGMVLLGLVLGMMVGGIGVRRLERRPYRAVLALTGTLMAVLLATTHELALLLLSLVGVVASFVTGLALVWLSQWKFRALFLAVPAMGILWFALMNLGLPDPIVRVNDSERPRPAPTVPNVLWVVLDTTRADHLPLYGHKNQTTPNIDALAREGVVFDRAYATAPWTVASHASMFTGLYSSQHWCNHEHLYLDERNDTIARILQDVGFDTAVFAGNPWLDDTSGLARGFSKVIPSWRSFTLYNLSLVGRLRILLMAGGQDKGAKASNEAFSAWFPEQQKSGRPFFAFFNYLEAHAPYHDVPFEDRRRFLPEGVSESEAISISQRIMERMVLANEYRATPREQDIARALYDGGIYNADRRLGEILDMLRKAGKLDSTLVIVTADHGELFGEHDIYGHDLNLYHPVLHVPLVMRLPGTLPAGVRVDKPVQLTDIFPSIMQVIGEGRRLPAEVRGQSVLPLLTGGGDLERPVFAEYYRPSMPPLITEIKRMGMDPSTFRLKSVQVRDLRLIRGPAGERLFDLSSDPGEERDLMSERPSEGQRLRGLLEQFVRENPVAGAGGPVAAPEMDAAAKEKLRSLGYIQ